MINSRGIDSPKDVKKLFTGIADFSIDSHPFKDQRSMTYRVVGKMKDIFIKGPTRLSKILTMDQDWSGVGLQNVKTNLINNNIYGLASYIEDEGATVWGLLPDDSLLSEEGDLGSLTNFNNIVKSDFSSRRWMSAFITAQKELGKDSSDAPFAISFLASVTKREIPWFGRVAWGVAVVNEIVSLTQIPNMREGQKDQYFTWSFCPRVPITESDLYSIAGKGGGESDYNKFKSLRDYLEKECEPLNPRGEYSFSEGDSSGEKSSEDKKEEADSENPLIQAAKDKSAQESFEVAQSYLLDETYRYTAEWGSEDIKDKDPDKTSPTRTSFPSGNPYVNKLKMSDGTIPLLGPQY